MVTTSRINKYPILSILDGKFDFIHDPPRPYMTINDPRLGVLSGTDYVWQVKDIKSFLKKHLETFKNNIVLPAESFFTALQTSAPSLKKAFDEEPDFMFKNLKYTTGILLEKEGISIFYHIDTQKRLVTGVCFVDDRLVGGIQNMMLGVLDNTQPLAKVYLSIAPPDPEAVEIMDYVKYLINRCTLISYFRTYADHDLKTVSGKSSSKLNNIEYTNPNKDSIKILDSSWYTSIVRDTGFNVTGHLRMQAYGHNWSERRLIYIDSFVKKGYIRKAKMLPRTVPGVSDIVN